MSVGNLSTKISFVVVSTSYVRVCSRSDVRIACGIGDSGNDETLREGRGGAGYDATVDYI